MCDRTHSAAPERGGDLTCSGVAKALHVSEKKGLSMNVLIVLAHPEYQSFNGHLAEFARDIFRHKVTPFKYRISTRHDSIRPSPLDTSPCDTIPFVSTRNLNSGSVGNTSRFLPTSRKRSRRSFGLTYCYSNSRCGGLDRQRFSRAGWTGSSSTGGSTPARGSTIEDAVGANER